MSPPRPSHDYETLEAFLAHSFRDRGLLREALTHRSLRNETSLNEPDNERLEFLGDAVLQLCVAAQLMSRYPEWPEGRLSLLRSLMVNEGALARAAERIELGRYLRLGRGEARTGGFAKPSLLANAFEALCGAVFRDAGFSAVQAVVERLLAATHDEALRAMPGDAKSRLQVLLQARGKAPPRYQVVAEAGQVHQRVFTVAVLIDEHVVATAEGRSKQEAEQQAAELALCSLQPPPRPSQLTPPS